MSHEYEEEAKEIMRKFKLQHEHNIINQSGPDPNQSPEAEAIIQQMNTTPSISTSPIQGNVCPQCKTIHPPLRPGEKCPNAAVDTSGYGLNDGDMNKYLVELRNIVMSQMSKKQIKDGKKFFQFTIIELMKVIEEYNE